MRIFPHNTPQGNIDLLKQDLKEVIPFYGTSIIL